MNKTNNYVKNIALLLIGITIAFGIGYIIKDWQISNTDAIKGIIIFLFVIGIPSLLLGLLVTIGVNDE